jgi:hypothetical protein
MAYWLGKDSLLVSFRVWRRGNVGTKIMGLLKYEIERLLKPKYL